MFLVSATRVMNSRHLTREIRDHRRKSRTQIYLANPKHEVRHLVRYLICGNTQRAHSTKNGVFTAHNYCAYLSGGGDASILLLDQNPSKCTNYFQVSGYTCTYLFFKHMPRSFAPKQRRQFEIFRKGDGFL